MKKRFVAFLLILAIAICAFPTFAFAVNSKTVVKDTILYTGPGTNYTALGYLHRGETFVQLSTPCYNYTHGYADTDTQIYAYYNQIMEGYVYYLDII